MDPSDEEEEEEEDDDSLGAKLGSNELSQSAKLMKRINGKTKTDAQVYMNSDADDRKLEIVEDDMETGKYPYGGQNGSNDTTKKKDTLKIGGKFALKFRALIDLEFVQVFIQEADFVFYQYIVDFLIPKVCVYSNYSSRYL